jgi:acetyl esterase/lipase
MSQSFTFYLVTFFIKQSGLKKIFSTDPVDYKKLRKTDVLVPATSFYKKRKIKIFDILKSKITEISNIKSQNKLVLFIHGGAFVSGPCQHHWDSIQSIVEKTDYNVWLCNYPKAPEHNLTEINKNIDAVYEAALQQYKAKNIILIGDSAGGSLVLTLTQRALQQNIEIPKKVIAISPVVDASFTNPKIDEVDKKDIILSKKGVLSAKRMTIGDTNINEKSISPINGDFSNFPELHLFIAENDISFPDQELLVQKLNRLKTNHLVYVGKKMPHIWPLLPIMHESKIALNQIIDIIKKD